MLLEVMSELHLHIICLCETHLWNAEQDLRWRQCVEKDGRYVWYGRCATRMRGGEKGQGSGGVGILLWKEWEVHAQQLPACRHSCLHFIRLTVPEHGIPITIGIIYLVPRGSRRHGQNEDLILELEERVTMYRSNSMIILAGDFDVHIADTPSTLQSTAPSILSGNDSSDESDEEDERLLLRRSVDDRDTSADYESGMSGVDFVQRMDALGMVILNGLEEVDWHEAEATFGPSSVIDYILTDADHWQLMSSVRVQHVAADRVQSDHQLIVSEVRLPSPATPAPNVVDGTALGDNTSFLLSNHRYRTLSHGDEHYWDTFREEYASLLPSLCDRLLTLADGDGSNSSHGRNSRMH